MIDIRLIGPVVLRAQVFVIETEPDALHLLAAIGHCATVATVDGGPRSDPYALSALDEQPTWALLFEDSEVGNRLAREVADSTNSDCVRLHLPPRCATIADVRERAGGVFRWLRDEWARFGQPWPKGTLEKFETRTAEALCND